MLQDRTLFPLYLSISLALITGSLHAEIYRWVDEDGVVNFTQGRPANVDATLIDSSTRSRTRTTQPDVTGSSSEQSSELSSKQETRLKLSKEQREMYDALQQKEADRQVEISRIRASNCKRSKMLLQRLSAKGRIRIRGDNGDERNLPDEERTKRIAEAQRGIVTNCDADLS